MLGVRLVWGEGVVGGGIMADANATLVAGNDMGYVGSGGGGGGRVWGVSIYMRGLVEHFFYFFLTAMFLISLKCEYY